MLAINADPVTIKQVEVEIVDRAFDEGCVAPQPPAALQRPHGGRRRLRAGRAGRRPAADPGRARGDRLRARRPARRPAALRHPRVQDAEAAHRPAPGRRWRPKAPSSVRSTPASTSPPSELRGDFDAVVLRRRRALARELPLPGPRAGRHPPGDGVPAAGQPGPGRRHRAVRSSPPASTWSSSAAATPAPTASAPPTGRAPRSVTQLEILPRPPAPGPATSPGRPTR